MVFCLLTLGWVRCALRLRRACRCRHLWRVVAAGRRLGGQQRQRHHRAGGGDARGDVVGHVKAVEEGRVSGVVDARGEHWMAGVGQLAGDDERGTDRCVGAPRDTGRQPRGSAPVSRLAYSDA